MGRLAGEAGGTSAGLGVLVVALAVWWLDLAAARDGGVHFAVQFMLVVSCAPETKHAIYDCRFVLFIINKPSKPCLCLNPTRVHGISEKVEPGVVGKYWQ